MTIRFYELTREGTAVVGDLRLENGKLTADPSDRQALVNLLGQPFELWDPETGERTRIQPHDEPERFLKGCLETYRGTYFWCRELAEPTDTDKRSI